MAYADKNWTLDTYIAATETDLIAADAGIIASLIMCNTAASAATVQLLLTDNTPTKRATILKDYVLTAGASEVLDMRSLYLGATDRLRINVDIVGVEFTVSGVEVV